MTDEYQRAYGYGPRITIRRDFILLRSRRKNRCIKCGKEGIFKSYLCKDCYMEAYPSALSVKAPKITICSTCKRYRSDKRWFKYDDLNLLIGDKIRKENDHLSSIDIIDEGKRKSAVIDDGYMVPVEISKEQCPSCQKEKSSYYEAIIQLRSIPKDIQDKILAVIKEDISSIREGRSGADIYIRSKNKIRSIKDIILKAYPAIVKESRKLFTEDRHSGKRIYRFTVLFKGIDLKAGDMISFKGDEYEISLMGKNSMTVRSKKGDKKRLSFDMLERYGAI